MIVLRSRNLSCIHKRGIVKNSDKFNVDLFAEEINNKKDNTFPFYLN